LGAKLGYEIPDDQRNFAHALIDRAGVSIVHGHSSHHPKAIEVYKSRLILYGCGDFLNDYEGIGGYEEFRGELALMYFATLAAGSGKLVALDMVPLRLRRFQLAAATQEEVLYLQRRLNCESEAFGAKVARSGPYGLALSWVGERALI
jgi:poly-gamma-glutamate synthesis protein (capsule biosynthesis protein)